MKKFKRTTVTSALPYANGPVHIGHLAGVYIPADIYVRYLRLKGEDVLLLEAQMTDRNCHFGIFAVLGQNSGFFPELKSRLKGLKVD
jgi:hypothetical protein